MINAQEVDVARFCNDFIKIELETEKRAHAYESIQ